MKKLVSIACALALAASLTACGGGSKNLTDTYIKVGASPSPHADILRQVQPILKEQGITLEIQEFDDYVMPNTALENGDLGANYFQHEPYLIDFNAQNNTFTVNACVTVILKIAIDVELLVPSYGYCAIPPAQDYSKEVCAGFFELPLYPQGKNCSCK